MFRTQERQYGFTLVEMLISAAIGVIISAVILQLFANIARSYKIQAAINTLNENGQYAIEYLSRDIRDLGFWGCVRDLDNIKNNINISGAGYNATYHKFDTVITGTEDDANDQDSITIKGSNNIGESTNLLSPYPTSESGALKVATNTGISQNDILIVSDCLAGDIFQVTNANTNTTGTIEHTATSTSPGNASGTLSKIYGANAAVYRPYTHIYEIKPSDDNVSGLFRTSEAGGAEELVHGVEKLVIYYGIDTTGNKNASRYVRFDDVADPKNIVSVRLELLLASVDPNITQKPQPYTFNGETITPNDNRVRRVYTRTIVIKNQTN